MHADSINMYRVRKASAVVLLAALAGLSGCGSDTDVRPVTQGPTAAPAPVAPVDGGITEGRVGEASIAQSDGTARVTGRGRPVRPSDARPQRPDREGVGSEAACAGVTQVPTPETLGQTSSSLLCLVNATRTDRGLVALTESAPLATAATAYARSMVVDRFFSHTGADGSQLTERIKSTGYLIGQWLVGENLAWGSGVLSTPQSIMTAWMDSTGHRENILNPAFREVGLGAAFGTPTGGLNGATYVHEFGVNTIEPDEFDEAAQSAATRTAAKPKTKARAKKPVPCSRRSTAKARKACVAKARKAAAARKATAARKARAARRAAAARAAAAASR